MPPDSRQLSDLSRRRPCAECAVEREKTGLDDIWCSSPECYVLDEDEGDRLGVIERITVDWCPDCGSAEAVWPGDVCTNANHRCSAGTVEYVRADLHAGAVDRIAALERELRDWQNAATKASREIIAIEQALEAAGLHPSDYRGQS